MRSVPIISMRDNTETYGKLKDAFAKAKANSNNLGCYDDIDSSNIWTYDRIIDEYESENYITLKVDIDTIKDIHYSRNDYNTYKGGAFPEHIDISKIGKTDEEEIYSWHLVIASYHQNTKLSIGNNIKLEDPTGHMEIVYDALGNLVTDARDIGTYNFAPSDPPEIDLLASIKHMNLDVVSWSEWGNSLNDTTKHSDKKDFLYYIYTFLN